MRAITPAKRQNSAGTLDLGKTISAGHHLDTGHETNRVSTQSSKFLLSRQLHLVILRTGWK